MRSFISMVFAAIALTGCAHVQNSSVQVADRLTPSVVPVYSLTGVPNPRVRTPAHKACSGVYVAPHLFVTTVSILDLSLEGTISYDVGGIKLMNDGELSGVQDVIYSEMSTGLVVIRTEEAGTPVPLSLAGVNPGDTLTVDGYAFTPDPFRGGLSSAERVTLKGDVSSQMPSGFAEAEMFNVDVTPRRGMSGSAVLDAQGRLVGIVGGNSGQRTAVISARTLAAVLQTIR